MSSLVIVAASVFEIPCANTDRQTNAEHPTPATAVGYGKMCFKKLFVLGTNVEYS